MILSKTSLRSKTLVDEHAKKLSASKSKKEDEAPVFWDRDSMMGVSGKMMSEKDRSKAIMDARALNDRFGHSKRGAYS